MINDTTKAPAATAFTWGDPEPVMGGRGLLDYIQCWRAGKWYEPPISLTALSKTFRLTAHHTSALLFKRNLLASTFTPTRLMSRDTFTAVALDYLVLGNGYVEEKQAVTGRGLRLERVLAKYTRRGVDLDRYYFLPAQTYGGSEHEFAPGSVHHLLEPDIDQEVYGLPEYLSALQSAFLNENATLFRRRYYLNGSHAGFILYMSDPTQSEDDIEAVRTALKDSKGPGNFRNLFMYSPTGKKDGVQVIPISEVAAKDEFVGIKNTTRDDVLAAHRVPPQLLGVVPQNTGGFGDVSKAKDVFFDSEIVPLQRRFLALNEMVGEEAVKFEPYQPAWKPGAANDGGRGGQHAA